ncbi:hypothetical protein ACFFX1_55055 [Dactylosporangium sucinum]|uniref:Uncharacterized protein n=1 Tax=Dactylosporangium sucinum TaxID=1424081 RepID=A0A917U2Q8_9ACTN|nr:hypothetical protein [Dactylosporangium sucinum]GGM53140.1 hypothetical protein GCM10007977_063490 [Dactylosporangium sucinum]
MAWRPARSLPLLHQQLQRGSRAAPPATKVVEWGLKGDAAHDPTSDHSPHDFPGWGNDIVTAADFPNRPDLGLDAHQVLDDLRRARDPRVKYAISNGEIFSNHPVIVNGKRYAAWFWRPYSGKDRHFTHGHLSVVGDARADDTRPWPTIGASPAPTLIIPEDTMAIIAKHPTNGQLYLCTGGFSHPISAANLADIKYVASQGAYTLAQGKDGAEWEGGGLIRKGWSPAVFGPVWQPAAPVQLTADQLAALTAAVGGQVAAQVTDVLAELRGAVDATREAAVANLSPAERAGLDGNPNN